MREIWVFSVYSLPLSVAFRSSAVFERPTLRGCQRWGALARVKALHALTLSCQKTNPDGVICGGGRGRAELRINNRSYGIVIVRFDGRLCR